MTRVRLDLVIAEKAKSGTLAEVCEAHGLPAWYAADLSRIRRGQSVTAERYRRIARALGVIPPPRKLERVAPSKEHRARRAALGVPWAQVIEAGLRSLEAPPP